MNWIYSKFKSMLKIGRIFLFFMIACGILVGITSHSGVWDAEIFKWKTGIIFQTSVTMLSILVAAFIFIQNWSRKIARDSTRYAVVDRDRFIERVLGPSSLALMLKRYLVDSLYGLVFSSVVSGILILELPNGASGLIRMDMIVSILYNASLLAFLASIIIILGFIWLFANSDTRIEKIFDDSVSSIASLNIKTEEPPGDVADESSQSGS